MNFLYPNLPMDVIKYILLFDEHFIIRKGEIVSIIPKSDYRYNLLKYITFKNCIIEKFHDTLRYNYEYYNLYDYDKRNNNNDDLIQVSISEKNDKIEYVVWLGRQKPNSIMVTNKRQMYFIKNPKEYHWDYIEFEYTRK
jgi:translation elongation factor EF-4